MNFRVIAEIQTGYFIFITAYTYKCCILTQVKLGKLIFRALKMGKAFKKLHTLKGLDSLSVH